MRNVACVQPGLLDTIYKELTLDASKEAHPITLQRIRMIFLGETGLLPDLRNSTQENHQGSMIYSLKSWEKLLRSTQRQMIGDTTPLTCQRF